MITLISDTILYYSICNEQYVEECTADSLCKYSTNYTIWVWEHDCHSQN